MIKCLGNSVAVKNIAIGTVDLGFDFRAGQIEHGSPPLRCFFEAVLSKRRTAEMELDTCYTLRRQTFLIYYFLRTRLNNLCLIVAYSCERPPNWTRISGRLLFLHLSFITAYDPCLDRGNSSFCVLEANCSAFSNPASYTKWCQCYPGYTGNGVNKPIMASATGCSDFDACSRSDQCVRSATCVDARPPSMTVQQCRCP